MAVLTDYAAMEAHKDDTLEMLYRSMGIVAEFPKQVIVLKGTQAVCALSGRASGLQRRMIDKSKPEALPNTVGTSPPPDAATSPFRPSS
jgi:hypothetical protein